MKPKKTTSKFQKMLNRVKRRRSDVRGKLQTFYGKGDPKGKRLLEYNNLQGQLCAYEKVIQVMEPTQ